MSVLLLLLTHVRMCTYTSYLCEREQLVTEASLWGSTGSLTASPRLEPASLTEENALKLWTSNAPDMKVRPVLLFLGSEDPAARTRFHPFSLITFVKSKQPREQ